MSRKELIEKAEFLVDADGKKKSVLVNIEVWEELITLVEDLEDTAEIQDMREQDVEAVDWEQAKNELRAKGIDV